MLYSEVLKSNLKAKTEKVCSEDKILTQQLCKKFVDEYGSSPGLKQVNDPHGYEYMLGSSLMNTDPFVRKSMKLSDRSMYESIRGYSRRPELALTLNTLAKFASRQADKKFKTEFEKHCWDMAIREARDKFQFNDIIPYDGSYAIAEMEHSTAAGFSWPGKKKGDVLDEIYSVEAYMRHNIHDRRYVYPPPAKLAQRGHMHDAENPKSRPVFVVPAEVIAIEGMYAIPYIEKLKATNTVLIGENSLSKLISLLNACSTRSGKYSIAMDWSAFDSSIPTWLIDAAFKIVRHSYDLRYSYNPDKGIHFHKKGKDDETRAKNSVKAHNLTLDWIQTNFKKMKIMLPNGSILKKMHGIPSGSYFTQVIGSICNYIVISFIMYYCRIPWFDCSVLGDDSYTRIDVEGFDLSKAAAIAKKYFGMTLNVKKSSVKQFHERQKFLGYNVEGLRLIREDEEFAKMVLYPERDVMTLEQSVSRVFAYYLLGGVNNPWYCKFYHQYLGHYKKYSVTHFTLSVGMYRTLKYVAGLDVTPFQNFPFDPGEISSLLCSYHFRFGYGIYTSDLFPIDNGIL